jgi:hypothetical protein
MQYVALSFSPTGAWRPTVDEFNRLLADTQSQPVFVYDRDGSLAGSLWYHHFRLAMNLADDEARARASRLGLATRIQ